MENEKLLRQIEAHREVVVRAEDGPWPARVDSCRSALAGFLADQGLTAVGAERLAVNLYGVPAEQDPAILRTTPLELAVPVED